MPKIELSAGIIEIADSFTLIPLDQPDTLAHTIRQFIQDTP